MYGTRGQCSAAIRGSSSPKNCPRPRQACVPSESRQFGFRFITNQLPKGRVLEGIIHVCEHHVLPDQQAEFVANTVKSLALVNGRTRQTNKIEACVAKQLQTFPYSRAGGQCHHVGWSPYHAAAENGCSVDFDCESRFTCRVRSAVDGPKSHRNVFEGGL